MRRIDHETLTTSSVNSSGFSTTTPLPLSNTQPFLQYLAIATAHPQPCATVQNDNRLVLLTAFQGTDTIQIHHRRTMNSAKHGWLQLLLQLRHTSPQKMRLSPHM